MQRSFASGRTGKGRSTLLVKYRNFLLPCSADAFAAIVCPVKLPCMKALVITSLAGPEALAIQDTAEP
ncbi:MAG: hypothetical protein WAU92_19345, partial [Candidatus Sulfotelmatobacter sp.]